MSRVWKSRGTSSVRDGRRVDPLVPADTYFVEVCGFTFHFDSVRQIRRYYDYFSHGDHFDRQFPFTRLPGKLLSPSNRPKVVKALARAIKEFADGE